MGLQELVCEFVAWFHLMQEGGKCLAALDTVTKLRVP